MDSVERTPVTTQQVSDLHARLVEAFGQGIDPAKVRGALEASGFEWVHEEAVEPERRMTVEVGILFDRWLWDKYCTVTGTSEWAVNEGQLDMSDSVSLTYAQAREIGLLA